MFDAASPKARDLSAEGADLAQHAQSASADLAPVDYIDALGGLPVWVTHKPQSAQAEIYDGLFWEIEPTGEYVSYLAGDFPKNEAGLLRYASASLSLCVETNFEDDVLNIDGQDGAKLQASAEANPQRLDDFATLPLSEIWAQLPEHAFEPVMLSALNGFEAPSLHGMAPAQFFKYPTPQQPPRKGLFSLLGGPTSAPNPQGSVLIRFLQFREPQRAGEYPRLLSVTARSNRGGLVLGALLKELRKLIATYRYMPYHAVSGATRY